MGMPLMMMMVNVNHFSHPSPQYYRLAKFLIIWPTNCMGWGSLGWLHTIIPSPESSLGGYPQGRTILGISPTLGNIPASRGRSPTLWKIHLPLGKSQGGYFEKSVVPTSINYEKLWKYLSMWTLQSTKGLFANNKPSGHSMQDYLWHLIYLDEIHLIARLSRIC